MAKTDVQTQLYDVVEILKGAEKLEPVYDAKQYTNRPFVLLGVEWKIFEPNERNNYNSTEKLIMSCADPNTGEKFKIETTQKGVTYPVAAIEKSQAFPCRIMIYQQGKYLAVTAK